MATLESLNAISTVTPYRSPGFAFIGTPINPLCELPFRLGPGVVFRRATIKEIARIKTYLDFLGGQSDNSEAFENKFTVEHEDFPQGYTTIEVHLKEPLPKKDWRYFVVAFSDCRLDLDNGGSNELKQIRLASHLTCKPLYINPLILRLVKTSDFTADWEHYTGIAINGGTLTSVDSDYVQDWKNCYDSVRRVQESHPIIAHSMQLYTDLPCRVGHNSLTTLGLFAVLESLLTHNPRGEEDSIGRQIRNKIALVEKRLEVPIDYSIFGQAQTDTVWKKLYELRSRIAHGTPVEFEKNLRILDDTSKVEQFMWRTLRSLLRGALKEPDLYIDLKAV